MPSFVKLSRTVSKLWSGHECSTADGRTDGRIDTQKFGGYNIIPRNFLWRGIKRSKGNFVRKNLKKTKQKKHRYEKVTGSEVSLTHKAERPSNYFSSSFTHYQAEQIKKGLTCVQILLEIHHSEHGRVHFQG